MLSDFINLFFPDTCANCEAALYKHESAICSMCRYHLPVSKFHLYNDNPVEKLFRGRVAVQNATAYLRFQKGGMAQKLVHKLKYKGRTEVGTTIGKLYGYELKNQEWDKKIDLIIPVPLHNKKLHLRGFNQCDFFAQGLSESLNVNFDTTSLKRIYSTNTQTKKSRYNRWKNAEGKFVVTDPAFLIGKNILLVDDVVTTGSTLEACAQAILNIEGTTVSIATMAYTEN